MRLLFERDLTPHPQYCAFYEFMKLAPEHGGFGAQAVMHLGMHGTVEWLPGAFE
jgi:magnesium chelatase subunit H